ncbi:MAG: DUF421 domain-containing protein [Actinomycetota bacterium]
MQIIVRSVVLFFFVWFVTRAVGRKELAGLSSFELILLIVMGDLIQQGVTGDDRSVVGAMLAVATFGLLTLLISFVSFKFSRVGPVVEGLPVVVLRDGEPLEEVLKIERLSEDEIKDAAREQGIADLRDVDVGIMESDGKFSFLRKDHLRPLPGTTGNAVS